MKLEAAEALPQPLLYLSSRMRDVRFTLKSGHVPKGAIYLNLLPMLNSGKVRLLANQRLASQLIGLERNTARGGRDSIDHARGGHDDVANAAAGALLAATAPKPRMRWGTIDFAGTGKVTWKDEEPPRQHIRIVTISEKEDLRRRGLL